MAHKTWTLQLEDGSHVVELEHGFWSGKRTITVDGVVVERSQKLFDSGSQHGFRLNGHEVSVNIGSNGLVPKYSYDLALDGLSQETHLRAKWAKPVPAWVPRVTAQAGQPVAVNRPSPDNRAGAEAIYGYMQSQIRQWGTTLLIMGVLHLVGNGRLNAGWGVLLLVVGASSFVLVDAALFSVYAVTLAWAGVSNLLGSTGAWMAFGLLQFFLAYRLFRQAAYYRRAQTTRDAAALDAPRTPAARVFTWLGGVLGVFALLGVVALVGWFFYAAVSQTKLPATFAWGIDAVVNVAVLAMGMGLGAMMASHRDKLLPAIGMATSSLVLVAWIVLTLLIRLG